MSLVTGITLITSCAEHDEEALTAVRNWLEPFGGLGPDVSDSGGGHKHPQVNLYTSGANYFDSEKFLKFFAGLTWDWPESVVLVLHDEGREQVCVYRYGIGEVWA